MVISHYSSFYGIEYYMKEGHESHSFAYEELKLQNFNPFDT
jgi:hypothetical protein